MKISGLSKGIIFTAALGISSIALAQDVAPGPTPIKIKLPTDVKKLTAKLKPILTKLGQTLAQTLSNKTNWNGEVISGGSSGPTSQAVSGTFTPDDKDGDTGTWTSSPLSIANLDSGEFAGKYTLIGNTIYLYDITKDGNPALSGNSGILTVDDKLGFLSATIEGISPKQMLIIE